MIACSIDETQQTEEPVKRKRKSKYGIRSQVMDYETPLWFYQTLTGKALRGAEAIIAYGMKHVSHKRRVPVNVDAMVDLWAKVLPELATAHDPDARDAAEAQIDNLLTPMLSCPVKQLREFYAKLIEQLKADPKVPYFIWRAFEHWHERFVKMASDEAVKKLKRGLATQIADMVEEDIRPDLREALIRALMWRDPGQLREVKSALVEAKADGIKPRVQGRQSCLFLQVPVKGREKPAEIML